MPPLVAMVASLVPPDIPASLRRPVEWPGTCSSGLTNRPVPSPRASGGPTSTLGAKDFHFKASVSSSGWWKSLPKDASELEELNRSRSSTALPRASVGGGGDTDAGSSCSNWFEAGRGSRSMGSLLGVSSSSSFCAGASTTLKPHPMLPNGRMDWSTLQEITPSAPEMRQLRRLANRPVGDMKTIGLGTEAASDLAQTTYSCSSIASDIRRHKRLLHEPADAYKFGRLSSQEVGWFCTPDTEEPLAQVRPARFGREMTPISRYSSDMKQMGLENALRNIGSGKKKVPGLSRR